MALVGRNTRKPRRKAMCLAIAFGLGLSTPTSSEAVLTELVVGGTILFQVAGIVGEALPQIAALTESFTGLVKSGEKIGNTFGRIVDILLPGKKKKKPPAPDEDTAPDLSGSNSGAEENGGTGAVSSGGGNLNLPQLKPRKKIVRTPSGEEAEAEEDSFDRLLKAYAAQRTLEAAIAQASEEQSEALEEGLRHTSLRYETAVEEVVTDLRVAALEGGAVFIASVAERTQELSEQERIVLQPVLAQLTGRGRQFDELHGEGEGPLPKAAFAALAPLAAALEPGS